MAGQEDDLSISQRDGEHMAHGVLHVVAFLHLEFLTRPRHRCYAAFVHQLYLGYINHCILFTVLAE